MPKVEIHYRRPPERLDVFVQELIIDRPELKVTFQEQTPVPGALLARDRVILEPGAPVVWFIFPGQWYDLGRFHLRDGTFTGYYTNLIRPPIIRGSTVTMQDLCLDLWIDAAGECEVLDEEEFDTAVAAGWIDRAAASRARDELERARAAARAGHWPPAVVRDYDLRRVRGLLARPGGASP
jgi:predicted RNA-binding protein associated with RNAse of E/G family